MSPSLDADWYAASPQQQARHWERKLDLLLRLEAEALVERLSVAGGESNEARAAYIRVVQK